MPLLLPRRTRSLAALTSLSAVVLSSAALSLPSYAAGGDRDHDGMPNRWESHHGLDPDHANGDGDKDHDGLSNLREYRRHTDPRDEDSDNDGHDDGDEVHDGSRKTRVLVRDTDDDGILDGDDDSNHNGVSDEDEDDAVEGCRGDDDDRDGDNVADEDERELGGRPGDPDSDDDNIPDGAEDHDSDGESDEDEDDALDDHCDDADEDADDQLGTIASYDADTGDLVVTTVASGELTFVVTDATRIEVASAGHGSRRDGSVDDLADGTVVTEVDVEDDDHVTTHLLEEIELAG